MTETSGPKTRNTRVVIIAGYASVRAGLRALLSAESDVDVRGDFVPTVEALARQLSTVHPDVLLLDTTSESGDDTLERTLDAVHQGMLRSPAIVVLGDAPVQNVLRLSMANLPGWGSLPRDAEGPQIAGAVRAVAAGLAVFAPDLPLPAGGDGAASSFGESHSFADLLPGETLTPREIEVLQLMAEGLPNKIIASRLGITLHTAKFHVAQILSKLDAASRTEAVTVGARRGYVVL